MDPELRDHHTTRCDQGIKGPHSTHIPICESINERTPGHLTWGFIVELRGIEPLTSSMPWKRSAN